MTSNTKHFPDRYAPFINLASAQIHAMELELLPIDQHIDAVMEIANEAGFKPVDNSIGKIKHILINVFMGHHDKLDERKLRNAFNKIFTDLVMKLLRPYGLEENVDNELLLTVSVQSTVMQSVAQMECIPTETITRYVAGILNAIFTLSAITHEDEIDDDKSAKVAPAQHPVLILNSPKKFGIDWALDHFIALQSSETQKTLIVESKKEDITKELPGAKPSEKEEDEFEVEIPSASDKTKKKRMTFKVRTTDLQISDGNVIFVGDYTLIGKNSLAQFGGDEQQFKGAFAKTYHVDEDKILIIGVEDGDRPLNTLPPKEWAGWVKGSQPLDRIDLFITPAGKDEYGRHRLLIGEPVFDHPMHFPMFEWTKQKIEEIVFFLQSQTQDFAIYRNPLPLTYVVPAPQMEGNKNIPPEKNRIWFFASYNNCITQYTDNKDDRYVWIPKYGADYSNEKAGCDYDYHPNPNQKDYSGRVNRTAPVSKKYYYGGSWSELKKYDDKNEKIWRSLGFNVIQLTNYLPMALLGGGVECTTKVLFRE